MSSRQSAQSVIEPLRNLKRSFSGQRIERLNRRTSSYVVGFGVNSSALMSEHTAVLATSITFLREYPDSTVVSVVGRASQTGPEATNRQLSRDRAERVRAYLVASGVPDDRVGPVVFHGSNDPVVNLPGREAEMNRSVELVIDWVDLRLDRGFLAGGSMNWKLDLFFTFALGLGIGGQIQAGNLTNRDTGASKRVTANILGLDLGQSVALTAAADAGLPFGSDGEFSIPTPPGPVDFDWFDGRFIVLTSVGASVIAGGVDLATLRFSNPEGTWPEAKFADYPIGLTLGVGGLAMIGFFNVRDL